MPELLKWDYFTFVNQGDVNMGWLQKTLSQYGEQGWEVTGVLPASSGDKKAAVGIIVIMKRPRPWA